MSTEALEKPITTLPKRGVLTYFVTKATNDECRINDGSVLYGGNSITRTALTLSTLVTHRETLLSLKQHCLLDNPPSPQNVSIHQMLAPMENISVRLLAAYSVLFTQNMQSI